MAYNRTEWENREVENPRTYIIDTNGDGTVTLVPAEGTIIAAGTPIAAAPLNNIEEGILTVEEALSQSNVNYIRQPGFASTSGTGVAYSAALDPVPTAYYEGFGITIVPHVANGANATLNVNGLGAIPLKDQRGNAYAAGRLLVGKPYTFRKVGSDFLADSAGGNGSAQPAHVLYPYSFTNDFGEFSGTMPHITEGADPAIGVGQWGDGALAVYPREGYRKGGSGAGEIKVSLAQLQSVEPQLNPSVVLEGNNLFGMNGAIPNLSARNEHAPGSQVTVWQGDRLFIQPPAGYFNGVTWVTTPVPQLVANNLVEGANVAGVVGTAQRRGKFASSNGWQNMEANQNVPWNINVGFRPQIVYYQYWCYYRWNNVNNEYGMYQVFGYGMMSKGTSGSIEKSIAANGFVGGPTSGFSLYNLAWDNDPMNFPRNAIDWAGRENINGPTLTVNSSTYITDTGFTMNRGYDFIKSDGSNQAQLNWYCI